MKILYTNFHSGPDIGGHTVYVSRLAAGLSGQFRIAVAAPASSALYALATQMPGITAHAQDYPSRFYKLPAALRTLRALLRAERFDVVHVNGSADHRLAILATRLMKDPPRIVFTKHNTIPIARASAALRARFGTHHVIAVCRHVEQRVRASPYGAGAVSVIFNGVDTAHFRPLDEAASAMHRRTLRPRRGGAAAPRRRRRGAPGAPGAARPPPRPPGAPGRARAAPARGRPPRRRPRGGGARRRPPPRPRGPRTPRAAPGRSG